MACETRWTWRRPRRPRGNPEQSRKRREAAAEAAQRADREATEAADRLERQLSAKRASLPPEPDAADPEVVSVMVRLPNGGRISRRLVAWACCTTGLNPAVLRPQSNAGSWTPRACGRCSC